LALFDVFNPLYAVSGFFVGAIVGLTGVGGGALMTPLLVLIFGVHPATAVGTDLLYAGLTKTVGTAVHGGAGTVSWTLVGRLALGSLPASVVTVAALGAFGPRGASASVLISAVLGAALLLTALGLVLRDRLIRLTRGAHDMPHARQVGLTIAVGAAIGVLVSISSVGAGAIGISALYFLYPGLPARTIVASDIAHAVPLTLVAGAGHWLLGSVDWALLASLLAGSIPGIVAGSVVAPRLPDSALRVALAGVLAVVGGRLVMAW
jgi:uncharacterized protein